MSKNFEEEYRQMIDADIPDLWDRIEARLPETGAAVIPVNPEIKEKKNVINVLFRNKKSISAAVMAAAAVLCVLVVRPTFVQYRGSATEDGYTASDSPAQSENSPALQGMADYLKGKIQGNKAGANNSAGGGQSNAMAESSSGAGASYAAPSSDGAALSAAQDMSPNAEAADSAVAEEPNMGAETNQIGGNPVYDQLIAEAQSAAEEYYRQTVFEVISMEVLAVTSEEIVFQVHCERDGEIVDPDRTVEVTYDGEQWIVINEGY